MKNRLASSLLVITLLTVLTGCSYIRTAQRIKDIIDDMGKNNNFTTKEELVKNYTKQIQNALANGEDEVENLIDKTKELIEDAKFEEASVAVDALKSIKDQVSSKLEKEINQLAKKLSEAKAKDN